MEKLIKNKLKIIIFYKNMSERIIINNLENTETKVLFNKSNNKIHFEIYGDANFYYTGVLDSISNNVITLGVNDSNLFQSKDLIETDS